MTDLTPSNYLLAFLNLIAFSLEKIANQGQPIEPNFVRPLVDFATFDWSSIGAEVISTDEYGPTHVNFDGTIWTRRSPANKYEPVIFFSRAIGKDDAGNTRYLRLITFREIKEAEPVSNRIAGKTHPPAPASQQQHHPISRREFISKATQLNVMEEAAHKIAALAGVTAGDDYTRAVPLLTFFAAAKKAGKSFKEAQELLDACNNDVSKAQSALNA